MNIIVAVDENWGIGFNGDLLMRIPEDMAMFQKITSGKVVVMGRCTFNSLPHGKPLKNRINVVLSKDSDMAIEGAAVCHSLPDLLKLCGMYASDDIYIIGGQAVYEQLLPYCTTAYVTKLWPSPGRADRFFPNLDEEPDWSLAEQSKTQSYNEFSYAFLKYVNTKV